METVDTEKKARLLEAGAVSIDRKERLKVFIQVNTSGEERIFLCLERWLTLEKAGIEPGEAVRLVKYIREECPHLEFSGLMTIGSAMASHSAQEEERNPDFDVIRPWSVVLIVDFDFDKREGEGGDSGCWRCRIEYGYE